MLLCAYPLGFEVKEGVPGDHRDVINRLHVILDSGDVFLDINTLHFSI
jgi:hypothetical protein